MKDIERRKFINSVISVFGLVSLKLNGFEAIFIKDEGKPDQAAKTVRLKGKKDSKVKHWDIITIGNLSRNRYWGESEERPCAEQFVPARNIR